MTTTTQNISLPEILNAPRVMSSKPKHDHAYVWLFMKGDSYLPGVITSVHSVKRNNPAADLVVMVTDDISSKARQILLQIATHLCDIPYVTFESKQMKTKKQQDMYEKWVSSAYSKWNALLLPYKKVCLLDADVIATTKIDELFDLSAPAAPIASPYTKPYGTIPVYYDRSICDTDNYPRHGAKITPNVISKTLNNNGLVITATPVILEPNRKDFDGLINLISNNLPFGFSQCHSAFDEQSLSFYYSSIGKDFGVIHQRYNYYPWHEKFITKGDVPRVIHFFSTIKPWHMTFDRYSDVISWYKMAAECLDTYNILAEDVLLDPKNITSAKSAEDTYIKTHIQVNSILEVNKML